MQAAETRLRRLMEGTQQYVIPLFQRPYSWSEKQWKVLWADVREKSRDADGRPHFFGSIVTTPARSVPQGVGKFLLIDGQQRLTTIQVVLAALRDAAATAGAARLHDQIAGQYLVNAYEDGDERLRVLPTQGDRAAFRAVVFREGAPDGPLGRCLEFFRGKLAGLSVEDLQAVHLALVDRMSVVSITCDEQDNPQLIFESLNAKGEKLTPADLIRNFLLMRVDVGDQWRLFEAPREPIPEELKSSLTEFVRHYLMKEGKILGEAEVYFELKDRLAGSTPAQAADFLADLHRNGDLYAKFVDPLAEGDPEVAARLGRIRRLKVTVAYTFLLRVFDAHASGRLVRAQVLETLDLLESFVIRRSICNVASNQLRRIFPPVFDATGGPGPTFIDGLRRQLGGSRCPGDAEFAEAIATTPLYNNGADKNDRLRLILERIDRSFGHKEPADLSGATIEHVLPQTLSKGWIADLGHDANRADALLHTLGNLTLSGYNSEMSNRTYAEKRRDLVGSHYEINRHFRGVERWDLAAIRDRGAMLARLAIEIWPDVGRIPGSAGEAKAPTQRPIAVRFRADRHPCKNWRDGFVKLVAAFEAARPGLMAKLAAEEAFYAVASSDPARFARSRAAIGGVVVNAHASAATLRDWLRKIAERGGFAEADYGYLFGDPPSSGEAGSASISGGSAAGR